MALKVLSVNRRGLYDENDREPGGTISGGEKFYRRAILDSQGSVKKPSVLIRELRKLFCQYALLNRQICMHKNNNEEEQEEHVLLL